VTWILLALIAAISTAARESFIKGGMRDGAELLVAGTVAAIGAVLLLPFALGALPSALGRSFWLALLVSGGVNALASTLIARAVHASDLSIVSPLQTLTPVFMIGTGFVFLGEMPRPLGVLGVAVVATGSYLLRLDTRRLSWLEPIRALARDRGARLMLVVALIFAVSGAVDKVGVQASTPFFWGFALNAVIAAVLLPLALLRGVPRPGNWRAVGLAGTLMAITIGAQMSALPLTLAAYVIAVKRTGVLFAVLSGGVVFGEPGIRTRLSGAAIMIAGVVLITLS
jgi:drug/metabolite transporter (DMT)-like permease